MRRVSAIMTAGLLLACAAGPTADAADPDSGSAGFGAGSSTFVDAQPVGSAPVDRAEHADLDTPAEAALREAVTGAGQAEPVEASAAPRVEPAAPTTLAGLERDLRSRLGGEEGVPAALELAALLCDLERHREALHVLTTMRSKRADPMLGAALASVHRDLGSRHLAVAELHGLRREQGAVALHPGLLLELAELEFLEGRRDDARATLTELLQAHADDSWTRAKKDELAAFARELGERASPQRVKLRDLLGNLRGAPQATVRQATLVELLRVSRRGGADAPTRALERRILAVGCGDDSPAVRAKAIQLGPAAGDEARIFCAVALADEDALVREVAVARTVELLGEDAVTLLLIAMAQETDASAFTAQHEALTRLAGLTTAPAVDARDAASRRAAETEWRQRWGR